MTASVPGNFWSPDSVAERLAARHRTVRDVDTALLNESVVVRRCAQYRKAFRCAAVSFPVDVLRMRAPGDWVRRYGVAVDVTDTAGFALALTTGVVPQRIIMHGPNQAAAVMLDSAAAGAGRFVVNSRQQVDMLAGPSPRRRRVLVDATDQDADQLVAAVISGVGLDMIGIHRCLSNDEDGPAAVRAAIATMRRIARRYNVIPARLSLGDIDVAQWGCAPEDLSATARAVDDAIEDGCIASRFPSPAVNIAPTRASLNLPNC